MLTREQCQKILDVLEITEGEEFYIRRHNTRSTFLYRFKVNEKGLGLYKDDDAEENMQGVMREVLMGEMLMGTLVIEKIPFKPKKAEVFHFVHAEGSIGTAINYYRTVDLLLLHMGNCFPTGEEAKKNIDKIVAKFKEMKEENARD